MRKKRNGCRRRQTLLHSAKPEAVPAPKKPEAPVANLGTLGKGVGRSPRGKREAQQKENFLRNEPSPGSVTRDVIGTISTAGLLFLETHTNN